jgi:hypothetical protein
MEPLDRPKSQDSVNPYAPPQSDQAPALLAGVPFNVNDVFNWSWSIFTERMGTCLSIFWGVIGLALAVSIVLKAVQDSLTAGVRDEYLYKVLYILSMFAGNVIQAWLGIGLTLALLKIGRRQPVSFEDVFSGGSFLLTALLAWVVHKVVLAVPIMIAVGVIVGGILLLENQSGVAAFLLFLVVSGLAGLVFIFLAARLSMYYYLVIDCDAGVFESLYESWRLCRNHVGTITLVYAVEFAVVLAGVLAFCVGLVFAAPLISLIDTVTYLALVTAATSGGNKPPFLWEDEGP